MDVNSRPADSQSHGGPQRAPFDHDGRNPLVGKFPNAVREKDDFFGRQAELKTIRDVLHVTINKPLIVQGERCIGKTSFFNRVKVLIEEEDWGGSSLLHFAIEPNSVLSCADFATEIWDGLRHCLQFDRTSAIPGAPFTFDSFGRFSAQLESLQAQAPGARFLVFIDEFDKALHQCTDLEQNRIMGLMRHLIEATAFPLIFLISVLQDMTTSYGSPIAGDKIELRAFDQVTTNEVIHSLLAGYATLDDDALIWLRSYTGGHPYFIKLLLTVLFDNYDLTTGTAMIDRSMLQSVGRCAPFIARADEVLADVYNKYLNDTERYAWLWLAAYEGKLEPDQVSSAPAAIRGIFKQQAGRDYLGYDQGGNYVFQVGCILDWLQTWPLLEPEIERLAVPMPITSGPATGQGPDLVPAEACIGVYVDLQSQRVFVDGKPIREELSDQEYRALVFLTEHAGEVVAKDDFARHVWREGYYEIDDQHIAALIHRLRIAVGDDQRDDMYLSTLRKRGFRLKNARLSRR